MKRTPFLLSLLCLISIFAAAQGVEICNDGIDNDGDGFIDCYDGSCANIGDCDGTFLGNDAKCEAKPSAFPQFTMTLDFSSPNETTNHLSRMGIGDLDRDGIPEIVTMNRYTKRIFVLNGRTGAIKHELNTPFTPQWEVAIANVDDDNCAEIFTFGTEGGAFYLYAYNCDLTTQIWRRQISSDPINFGLADFNGDGKVELYAKDEIFDAKTGTRLIQTKNWNSMNGGPVAVDMEGDANLELVVGGYIYSVNLGSGAEDNGSLTELKKIPDYYIRYDYNATSVADFNLDGFLDVIASGSTVGKGKNTTIFFWDVHNNVVKTFFDNSAGAYLPNGWSLGTGRVNIADLDGDGQMNASYVSGKFLYALDENLNLFWRKVINEETSGHTGCTLFDFNGDGKSEIVYRDERFLYIINGTDGSVYNQQNCVSRTNREYPIVADVDADGSTEMCVPCGFDDDEAWDEFDDIEFSRYSHVRVYKSAAEPWVPARRVWNQHGYFNVNVNDDLTIPKRQQKHHLVFSTGSCTTGPNRPLNGFLNQSPFLNSLGCPTYASPDLAYVDNSLSVNPPTCPDKKFTVSFRITNKGDQVLDGTVPITFYNGNPAAAGAVKLGTINANLTSFGPAAEFAITNAEVTGPGSPFTLFIVLNDNGTTVPTPIKLPNTNFVECDYSNNIISAPVLPKPVTIIGVKVADNAHCDPSTTPNNGAVEAYVPVGTSKNTTDYTFFWFNGTVVDSTPDFTGVLYSGIAAGTYSVFARHKTAQCNSDTVQVVVGLFTGPIEVTINLLAPVTDCKNPNGSLGAVVVVGGVAQPPSAYTYAWYKGNDIFTSPQVGVNNVATNLEALTYTVVVTEKLSGCRTIQPRAVPSTVAPPVVVATKTDIICSSSNSGIVSATADGVTAGYKFEWYKGTAVKPAPDFTGASWNNRPAGDFTVVATKQSSNCVSVPHTVSVVKTSAPAVTATKNADMTSCDPSKPNGAATASVGGGPAGFTFEWYKGTVLTPPNRIGTAAAITGLAAGTYTVKVTQNGSGCSSTDDVVIDFDVVFPTLANVVQHVTTCTPYNGQVTITPSIDTPADFTYTWTSGSTTFPDTDNILSNLGPGSYTVSAVHKTKFCNAPPITVTVLDNSPVISMVLNSAVTQFPSDCNAANGAMTVDVTATGNTLGFKVEWFFGRAPFAEPIIRTDNGVTTSTATGLKTGVYSVIATDLNTGCSKTEEFDLPFADAHELEIVSTVDVVNCVPGNDGSALIKLLKSPRPEFDEADYDIFVYAGSNDPGVTGVPFFAPPIAGIAGTLNYNTPATFAPGSYIAVAVSNNVLMLGCRSVPKLITIKKNTVDPLIVPTAINANENCIGAAGTGSITVSADSGNPMDYTFEWFQGSGTGGTPVAGSGTNGETVTGLVEGYYTVKVTKNTAPSNGCISLSAIPVGSDPMNIDISGAGFATNNLTSCDALSGVVLDNGSATVSSINDGAGGVLVNYNFEWTTEAGAVILDGPSATVSNLAAGAYFVKATNTTNACLTNVPFEIVDMTVGSVGVTLDSFENPERCIELKAGRLKVIATGTSGGGYGFEWYNGPTAGGSIVDTDDELAGIVVPNGQAEVLRTIRVTNMSNNCKIADTYTVPLTVNTVMATTSASPLTNCATNDGTVFGAVTNDNSLDYDYNWYNGPIAKASPDHTGQLVVALTAGEYTMVAVDKGDSFCVTLAQTVIVEDERVHPEVTTTILSPVTNCDPTKANGGVSAGVKGFVEGGDIATHTFEWFNGATAAGTPIFNGAAMTGLPVGTYTVLATNRISRCTGEATAVIIQVLEPVPNPTIVVVQNVTSCVLENGILSASVNGNTADYDFVWYEGTSPTGDIDFHGEVVDSLAVGSYTVTATSRITGCTTGPDTDQIIEEHVFPDFEFKIVPASCEADNGFASLVMASNVPIARIEWHANGETVIGPNLENIGAGTYDVTVISELGCETNKTVTIGTEIRPYNGVSRNGDGRNEIFNISCIENFPGNNVKIFNRAGTMVYEGEGYNNVDIYFDGKSNRGVSPMGLQLPDGTYYYVIDKRDGSKPLAGYIELVK